MKAAIRLERKRYPRASRSAESGFVLVVTLVVLAIVLSVALAFAFMTRLELRTARNAVVTSQNRMVAEAGVNYALARLATAAQAPYTDEATITYSSADRVELDEGAFSVTVTDESARINLNTVGEAVLSRLPGADSVIVDSVLDWRDTDEDQRANGAESSFYAGLESAYQCKNGPFDTVAELGMVRGVTPTFVRGIENLLTVYSSDPDLAPDGRPKLDLNHADAAKLAERLEGKWSASEVADVLTSRTARRSFNTLGELVDVPGLSLAAVARAVDYVTTDPEPAGKEMRGRETPGRVNLNTAAEEVLGILPGMTDGLLSEVLAARQQTPFRSLEDLFGLPSFDRDAARQLLGLVTVQSRTFSIRARGWRESGVAGQEVAAVVDFGGGEARILAWRDGWPDGRQEGSYSGESER